MKFFSDYEKKSRMLAQCMIKFCILELDLSHILHKQLVRSKSTGALWTRKLTRLTDIRARACIAFCVYYIAKYCLIRGISSGLLGEHAKWLDCWILGRSRLLGRMSKISDEIAVTFVITCTAYRLYLVSFDKEELRFPALEFLMSEQTMKRHNSDDKHDVLTTPREGTRYSNRCMKSHILISGITSEELMQPIKFKSQRATTWILRPNRTPECWRKLNSFTVYMFFYSIISVTCCIVGFWMMNVGSIFTDFGYELSYPTCVTWIRSEQARLNSTHAYEHIYRVVPYNKLLAGEHEFEKVPVIIPLTWTGQIVQEWRLYNIARITVDILENAFLYIEGSCLLVTLNYVLLLNILDIVLYSERISARLAALIERLESHNDGCPRRAVIQHHSAGLRGREMICLNSELVQEICHTQAILYDHFSLVCAYNHFNNWSLRLMCLNWALWTIIMCTWMKSVRSYTIELGFIIIELITTCYALFFLAMAGIIHSKNMSLYRQITHLMALDSTTAVTKTSWTALLRFYYPKPLFCFTLYSSSCISRLFCLKLISWVASAFVLLANFFYSTQHQS